MSKRRSHQVNALTQKFGDQKFADSRVQEIPPRVSFSDSEKDQNYWFGKKLGGDRDCF